MLETTDSSQTGAPIADLGPLAWVFDELRKSLEGANKAIKRFVRESEKSRHHDLEAVDPSALRLAGQQLHQAVGALEMVGLDAPALVLRAMEAAVQRFVKRPLVCDDEAASRMERASFALVDYLEAVLNNKPVQPVALFPQYRLVQELAAAERVHPADLWSFERLSMNVEVPANTAPLKCDAAMRSLFDRLVLLVVKTHSPAGAVQLSKFSAGLSAGAASPRERTFWHVTAAYFEAVAHQMLPDDVYVKRAASRILMQFATLAQGQGSVSEELLRDLLFFCAQAKGATAVLSPYLMAVRKAYDLERHVPVDYEHATLGRFDPAVLAQARKRIGSAKETWSLYAGGDASRARQVVDQFSLVGDSLIKLQPDSKVLAQALLKAADQAAHDPVGVRPELAMEVATTTLYLEATFEDFDPTGVESAERAQALAQRLADVCGGGSAQPLVPWMEQLYRRVSDRQTMGSVVGELKLSLNEVEKSLDQFFRSPTEKACLNKALSQLAQMRGVLSVLGLDHAVQSVVRMRTTVDQMLDTEVDQNLARQAGTFQQLGNNLSALSFLVDMLNYQPSLARKLFVFDAEKGELQSLMGRYVAPAPKPVDEQPVQMDSFASAQAPASTPPIAVSSPAEAVLVPPSAPSAAVPILAAEPAMAQVPVAPVVTLSLPELSPTAVPAPAAVTVAPPAVSTPAKPTAAPTVQASEEDDELREIFLEEAREVAANGLAAIAALQAQPGSLEDLTTLRRAFHTLKGSSRMVGLMEFGEAAWAMEQLTNAALAEQRAAHPHMLSLSADAMAAFARWIEDIAQHAPAAWQAEPFRTSAEAWHKRAQYIPLQAGSQDVSGQSDQPDQATQPEPELPEVLEPERAPESALAEPEVAAVESAAVAAVDPELPVLEWSTDLVQTIEITDIPELTPLSEVAELPQDAPPVSEEAVSQTLSLSVDDSIEWTQDWSVQVDAASVPDGVQPETVNAVPAQDKIDPVDGIDFAVFEQALQEVEASATEQQPVPTPAVLLPALDEPPAAPTDLTLELDWPEVSALPADAIAEPVEDPVAEPLAVTEPIEPELVPAPLPEPEPLPEAQAVVAAPVSQPTGFASSSDDQTRVIGHLRIGAKLFSVYLSEADEWSRRLDEAMNTWAHEGHLLLPTQAESLAHSLAGSSAAVGFQPLSDLARALEHACESVSLRQEAGRSVTPDQVALLLAASEDIRRLLHQFAAGFLQTPRPELLDGLFALVHEPAAEPEPEPVLEPLPPETSAWADEALAEPFERIAESVQAQAVPESQALHVPAEPVSLPSVPQPLTKDREAGIATMSVSAKQNIDDDIDAVDTIDVDLFPIFADEAHELLPLLDASLRQWVAHPDHSTARSEVLRYLHTLKGSARLSGALRLGEMVHRMETTAERLGSDVQRSTDLEPLQAAFDAIVERFEALSSADPQTQNAVQQAPELPSAPDTDVSTQPDTPAAAVSVADLLPVQKLARPVDLPRLPTPVQTRVAAAVRVRSELLDRLVNQIGEVMITRSRMESELVNLRTSLKDLTGNLDRLRQQLRDIELQAESQMQSRLARDVEHTFDPLEFDRYTRVQELTRMMAESVNDVATVQRNLQRAVESTEDGLVAQSRQTRELQRDLLRTRMVEFEGISERLYRVVRQAAKETGKLVRLDIVGGQIEMDRGVLDRVTAAFEHLLRNSVVHGIEKPELRLAQGKSAEGRITVGVSQALNDVSVLFADDGAGLNLPLLRQKAVDKGVLAPGAVISDDAAAQLVFAAGLSTVNEVSELAGRGVGMDVVRNDVLALGGRIETSTQPGMGTTFKLVLPLTTAVTQVVMLRAGEVTLGVPSNLVEVVRRVSTDELAQAYRQNTLRVADEDVPFYWGGALLMSSVRSTEPQGRTLPVVVFRSAAQRLAMHVDEVLGNQEVVVKNLGPQLSRLPGLAGMSVLASGAVALIYNPVALSSVYGTQIRAWLDKQQQPVVVDSTSGQPAAPVPASDIPLVLVVDDSITVRRVTQRLLQREGYRVALAADGLQALERLQQERPAVVLSDIEMPRMDGFDLLRNIRGDVRLKGLPVIMITSRIADKHREHARELGADHYLGKPYPEEELLALIARYARAAAFLTTA
ncbi:MAG: hypothetical protein RLZZ352_2584 [Pseudomonadota bacterium]|jgi:chemosensory pili system protein ChpA (sensor histidine kinase/response regulator)